MSGDDVAAFGHEQLTSWLRDLVLSLCCLLSGDVELRNQATLLVWDVCCLYGFDQMDCLYVFGMVGLEQVQALLDVPVALLYPAVLPAGRP